MTFEPTWVGTRVQFDAHGRTSGPMRLAELFLRLTLVLDLTAATAVLMLATSDPSACSLRRSCNLFSRPYAQLRTSGAPRMIGGLALQSRGLGGAHVRSPSNAIVPIGAAGRYQSVSHRR